MANGIKIIISIAIIAIVSLFIFAYLASQMMHPQDVTYKYEVEINTNGTREYSIYIPIPIEVRDINIEPSKMIQNIKIISGNATFFIIDTEKGMALNITFKGDVHLKVSGTKKWEKWEDENYDYDILSLQDLSDSDDFDYHGRGDIPYWVWCGGIENNETISINIESNFGNIYDRTSSEVSGKLIQNGWQILYGSELHKVT